MILEFHMLLTFIMLVPDQFQRRGLKGYCLAKPYTLIFHHVQGTDTPETLAS